MGARQSDSRLPWWHRRVVVASDDEAWARRTCQLALQMNAEAEPLAWSRAAALEGPVGALVAHVGSPGENVERALVRWAAEARQPLTLLHLPPVRGAARLAHLMDALGYELRFRGSAAREPDESLEASLARILERGGWIVPRFASALGWSTKPFLVHVLSLPLLARDPPASVKAWRQAAGNLSYGEFEALFRLHGAPPPKQVLDRLRIAGAAVWAAGLRNVPERRVVAGRLGYSDGAYLGRRVRKLSGLTAGGLLRLPVEEAVEALARPLPTARSRRAARLVTGPAPGRTPASPQRRKVTPITRKVYPTM